MIVLFTDFGLGGPYVGQMKVALLREAPQTPVLELFSDLPPFNVQGAAYLLAAYATEFPVQTVFLCVVDPGVGTGRRAAAVRADARWYVGPDNGLFDVVARRASDVEWWDLHWQPARLSASFHGRDLFAPVAAWVSLGQQPPGQRVDPALRVRADWPDDLARVLYIDGFGNAMTGLRAATLSPGAALEIAGRSVVRARTFGEVPPGTAFCYENANGLMEVAVNQGRADRLLGIRIGDVVGIQPVEP